MKFGLKEWIMMESKNNGGISSDCSYLQFESLSGQSHRSVSRLKNNLGQFDILTSRTAFEL